MKFFVSYSRSIKNEVGAIVKLLRAAGHEVWWDGDIPAIADWWAKILENIEQSEIVLFMVSEKSVQSPYCLEELRYGIKLNRPILPFIMDDQSRYTLPPELGRRQWYVYDGDPANTLQQIIKDCRQIPWQQHTNRSAPRPAEPGSALTVAKQFQQAVSLAEAGKFDEARQRFESISSLDYEEWGADCQRWIVRLLRYADIADLADSKATLTRARTKWNALIDDDPEVANFDPLLVNAKLNTVQASPAPSLVFPTRVHIPITILPAPFDWIDIPSKGYSIAKYPITYSQFAKFVEVGGYEKSQWWTSAGWEAKLKGWEWDSNQSKWVETNIEWTQPHYWTDSKWNGQGQPVVGVSWYEAVAFCQWLSEVTKVKIMLLTEDQWQYAAQGDDGRAYPWGSDWDCARCNNSVKPCVSNVTTSVQKYEGKGDSPFGVVDMAGNVWEWCLTDFENKTNDFNSNAINRVLRGGSWYDDLSVNFRCDSHGRSDPASRNELNGFRIARF